MTLLNFIKRGIIKAGGIVETLNLYEIDLQPCKGCFKCYENGCVLNDEIGKFQKLFEQVDHIIFGTPVYYWFISSKLKILLDRPVIYANNTLKGKTAYFAISMKGRKENNIEPMLKILNKILCYNGITYGGKIIAGDINLKEKSTRQELIKKHAIKFGYTIIYKSKENKEGKL